MQRGYPGRVDLRPERPVLARYRPWAVEDNYRVGEARRRNKLRK